MDELLRDYEIAMKDLYVWETKFGTLNILDLWELSLEQLDEIAKDLYKKINESEISFISNNSKTDEILKRKFKIVKRIIDVKLEERNARLRAKEIAEKKQLLMQLLKEKELENLKNKDIETIKKELEELEKLEG